MLLFIPRSLCALKRIAAKEQHARYAATQGIRIALASGIYRAEKPKSSTTAEDVDTIVDKPEGAAQPTEKVDQPQTETAPAEAQDGTGTPARKPKKGKRGKQSVMDRYQEAKEKHPGMVLLFRIGDFYELFHDDATLVAPILGLTLTTRDKDIPMAGFPHHALQSHLQKLLEAGHRVAICDEEGGANG